MLPKCFQPDEIKTTTVHTEQLEKVGENPDAVDNQDPETVAEVCLSKFIV